MPISQPGIYGFRMNGLRVPVGGGGEGGGTYSMAFDPESFTINPGNEQVVAITLTQLTGSAQMVTLSLPDLPDGWTGDFSANPITSDGGTSNLTLTAP